MRRAVERERQGVATTSTAMTSRNDATPIAVSRIVAPITPGVSSDAFAVWRYVPSPCCADATHSPITAPVTAYVAPIFRPEKSGLSVAGSWIAMNARVRFAPITRARLTRSRST